MAQDYRDLVVWQRAIELTVCVYQLTGSFPKDEVYGPIPQLRRAAVSVASNIAEGRGRLNVGEFRQFLGLAQGSIYELQTQLLVARKLGMGSDDLLNGAEVLSNEISKRLGAFIQTLNRKAGSKQLEARS
jgi:four helix bundle protein